MSGRVCEILGTRVPSALAALALLSGAANAQTVTLPAYEDTTLQGGAYQDRNFGNGDLVTRASPSDPTWIRHALLKFDTHNLIPAGATITSAMLTVTVKDSYNAETRTVTAYCVHESFWEMEATWLKRNNRGLYWSQPGGTMTHAHATAVASAVPESQVAFDVTQMVQEFLGQPSRYTRLMLVDRGATSKGSLRYYHSNESSSTSLRPRLVVTYSTSSGTVTVVRGPYLQQVGAARAIVVWATREPGPATVEYRTGTAAFSTATASSTFWSSSVTGIASFYQHEAVLDGLRAGTTYHYDLGGAGVDATPGVVDQFRTAPAAGTGTIRLVAFGDSGTGSTSQSVIADRIKAEQFDLAVHNGDIAYSNGTYAEFEARFFPYYRDWLRRVAIFPSIGNHDERTASATPYRRFFVLPPDEGSATFPNNAERFYSFDFGPVHFIALDTEAAFLSTTRRQEQIAWLTEDLQASQHMPWRVAFFHRPPFSSGEEHGSDAAIRAAFVPLFEQYDVQLVLNGHEHSYERTVPWRTSTNTDRQAVTYVITGAAGAPLYPVGRNEWTAHSRSASHYVRALVTPSDLTIEAVDTNGAVFDRFTLDRAMQKGDVSPPQVAIAAPSSGEVLTGVETVAVTATDDGRVEKVDIRVDGQLLGFDVTAPYTFSLDTRTLSNGPHSLEVIAYDIDGKSTIASRTVTVSNGLAAGDIVLYAREAPAPKGIWRIVCRLDRRRRQTARADAGGRRHG